MSSKSENMPRRPAPPRPLKLRAARIAAVLAAAIPEPRCGLNFRNAYELVAATILSAQCSDAKVNTVTPALFARFPTPAALAAAAPAAVEPLIKSLGLFRAKAKNLVAMAQTLLDRFHGEVPATIPELVLLPGVGRKTANCVLVNVFHLPGIMVDTHCLRLVARWQLTAAAVPDKVEADLKALLPEKDWRLFSERVILFGRTVCTARNPRCAGCPLQGKLCKGVKRVNS